LAMAGELELDGLQRPFQLKPFYDSVSEWETGCSKTARMP